jgi:hypothetical protein
MDVLVGQKGIGVRQIIRILHLNVVFCIKHTLLLVFLAVYVECNK